MLRTIQSRVLWLVLVAVMPLTGLIAAGLWVQWQRDQADALERVVVDARTVAARVDDHIETLQALLAGISRTVSLEPDAAEANDALLREIKNDLPPFVSNLLLFAPDGTNIGVSASHVDRSRYNASDRAFFKKIVEGQSFAVGEPILTRSTGQWVVTASHGILDESRRLRAVVAVGSLLADLKDVLRVGNLPPGSAIRIVNENGTVVASTLPGANWIGRDLSGLEQVARHLRAKQTSEVARWGDDIERITASSTATKVPWLVSVGMPRDVGLADVYARLAWNGVLSTGAVLFALLIAWLLSRRITGPLRQLGQDASTLAAGDLGHRSTLNTEDEIGALARTFNRMAEALEQRQEQERQAKETLAAVVDASPVAIVCLSAEARVMVWSRAAEQMFEYTADEALGQPYKLVPPGAETEFQALLRRALAGETLRGVQVQRRRKDGVLVDINFAAAAMYDREGIVRGVAYALEDITERKKAEERLKYLAHFDPLTELPNRTSLQSELTNLLALAGDSSGAPTCVAMFDLDGFKEVNDTLGHSTGDQLLRQVAGRLVAEGSARIYRQGGDEFVAIFSHQGDPRTIADATARMLTRIAEPFEINQQTMFVRASAGITIAPNDATNVDDLLANADLALYQAKLHGGGEYAFYMPQLRSKAYARRKLDLQLRRACEENEFELHFQPKLQLKDRAVIGAEALLRWRHPERGIVAPGAFIEALAENPAALDVGRWILRSACQSAAAWRVMGLPAIHVAVNLFPVQFRGAGLLRDIEDALAATGLPPEALELEITENIALSYDEAIVELLRVLRSRGIKVALDDFGTGYASLSYLRKYPLSRIKIDRSFVRTITDNPEDAAIVRATITMAHSLGLEVTAEGVETVAQEAFLLAEGCDEAQGYLYAKPLAASEFEKFLRANQAQSSLGRRSVHQ